MRLVSDINKLEQGENLIDAAIKNFEEACDTEEGLTLIPQYTKVKKLPSLSFLEPLPISRKKKPKGTVGSKYDREKAAAAINLNECVNGDAIEEEIVPFLSHPYPTPQIADVEPPLSNQPLEAQYYLPHPDKRFKSLNDMELVDDNVISDLQGLLAAEFPDIAGLQDQILGDPASIKTRGLCRFRRIPAGGRPLVQVLHTGCAHWVLVSTINCEPGTISLYDTTSPAFSRRNPTLSNTAQTQISQLLLCELPIIKVKNVAVQRQESKNNCGLLAIAIAYEVLLGGDPSKIWFEERSMRAHSRWCLSVNKISPYPKRSAKPNQLCGGYNYMPIKLWCSCRRPFFKFHGKHDSLRMAECNACKSWFHQMCGEVPKEAFETTNYTWNCSSCITHGRT